MKTKAFTLIEILLASLIFMIVVTVAVTSLTLMRKSTDLSNDLSSATGCAREMEDYISNQLRKDYAPEAVYGINNNESGTPVIESIPKDIETQYSGILLSQEGSQAMAIWKDGDSGYYLLLKFDLSPNEEINGRTLKSYTTSTARIESEACHPFITKRSKPENLSAFALNFEKPFQIKKIEKLQRSYLAVKITDFLYFSIGGAQSQEQAIESQSFGKLFVDVLIAQEGI